MAYVTGTVNNITDLRTAIFNACTANGWTLSGEVLHKGTAYFRLYIVGSALLLIGGTGKDGSNNLTGLATFPTMVTPSSDAPGLVYPVTYHIHINSSPDEVYVFLNHSSDYYQYLAFGQSDVALPGTGNWFCGLYREVLIGGLALVKSTAQGQGGSQGWPDAGFFCGQGGNELLNSHIHHNLEGGSGWSGNGAHAQVAIGRPTALTNVVPLVGISPNAYNGEALLLPIPVTVARPSSFYSLVAQLRHSRYIRIDHIEPGQILTIGGDQWKVYPWLKKNASVRNGGAGISHSGTFGCAIRHTP